MLARSAGIQQYLRVFADEFYGVLMGERAHTEEIAASWMMGNNFMSYTAWILGTVLGTALGALLPNPKSFAPGRF